MYELPHELPNDLSVREYFRKISKLSTGIAKRIVFLPKIKKIDNDTRK